MKKVLLGILLFFLSCINVFALEKELYNVSFQKDILGKKDWTSCNASSNYSCRATVMDKFWPSNNERIYYYKLISDGDKSKAKYYIYYNNVYPSSTTVQNSSDKRALKENEYFTFYVKNLNIKTSEYKDLRLNIDYAESTPGSGHSIIKNGGFEIYVIDQNNKTWGPYTVGDYTFNGIYKRDNYEEYYRGYNIISENLNKNKNITIKELKIVPYGNMPKKCSDGTWFCQRSFMFASVSINGYTDSNYKNPNVQLKKINVDSLRINTVRRMYDIATIKWTPTQSMKTVLSVKGFHYGTGSYEKDKFYYGPAYNQMNRVSVEKVYSVLDKNKKLPYVTDKDKNGTIVESANNFGADCAYAVFDAVSYYVPLTNLYSTVDALFDRTNITILGGLKADGKSADTSKVYTNLVNKYKNSSSTAFNQKVNQRLRSNDSRIWYLNTLGDDGYYYPQLGYTNMNSTTDKPAVSSSESLTLTLYNLNIAANKDTNVTIKYIIDERQTSNVYLDTSKLKIYGCSSDDVCNLFTDVKLNNNTKIIRTYDSGKRVILNTVTASIKNNRTITTIKILPYGTGSKKGEVFKFNRLELKVDNSSYLNVDAGNIVTYLSLYQYVGNLLDTTNTKLINKELTSAELNSFYSKYRAAQDMYKGYSELLVGDMISMNSGTRTHIRLITGSTHLVCLDGTTIELNRKTSVPTLSGNCDNHEGIDATRSYIIRSDISSSHPASSYNDRNNYGGFINSKDYVPSWTPNSKYTDIKKLTDLKDKNLDFYTNSKLTFETLLNTHYLPLRLNDYINGQIEKPYVTYINGNTVDDIKNGFKGSIFSNYPIISVKYVINNKDTSTVKTIVEYPSHAYQLSGKYLESGLPGYTISGMKEGVNTNSYSLYYSTLKTTQDTLKNTLKDSNNFDVKVTIQAGNNTLEVLHLTKTKAQTPVQPKEEPTPSVTPSVPDDPVAPKDSTESEEPVVPGTPVEPQPEPKTEVEPDQPIESEEPTEVWEKDETTNPTVVKNEPEKSKEMSNFTKVLLIVSVVVASVIAVGGVIALIKFKKIMNKAI